VPSSG
jgi:hypothetical protein